ncbi:hypothetical protein BD410DRAFT_845690 [Rickenella mellea]|uniref:Uncharacterized protein n=1 Tax=Rickenella mellea TaxID=50990 RepID=A0A4Y7PIC1_9AGAM|nr:hypothetical protein BD410DRAFT_845690 [Rickenella mellea]
MQALKSPFKYSQAGFAGLLAILALSIPPLAVYYAQALSDAARDAGAKQILGAMWAALRAWVRHGASKEPITDNPTVFHAAVFDAGTGGHPNSQNCEVRIKLIEETKDDLVDAVSISLGLWIHYSVAFGWHRRRGKSYKPENLFSRVAITPIVYANLKDNIKIPVEKIVQTFMADIAPLVTRRHTQMAMKAGWKTKEGQQSYHEATAPFTPNTIGGTYGGGFHSWRGWPAGWQPEEAIIMTAVPVPPPAIQPCTPPPYRAPQEGPSTPKRPSQSTQPRQPNQPTHSQQVSRKASSIYPGDDWYETPEFMRAIAVLDATTIPSTSTPTPGSRSQMKGKAVTRDVVVSRARSNTPLSTLQPHQAATHSTSVVINSPSAPVYISSGIPKQFEEIPSHALRVPFPPSTIFVPDGQLVTETRSSPIGGFAGQWLARLDLGPGTNAVICLATHTYPKVSENVEPLRIFLSREFGSFVADGLLCSLRLDELEATRQTFLAHDAEEGDWAAEE